MLSIAILFFQFALPCVGVVDEDGNHKIATKDFTLSFDGEEKAIVFGYKSRRKSLSFSITAESFEKWWYTSDSMDDASDFGGGDFLVVEAGTFAEVVVEQLSKEKEIKKIVCKFDYDGDLRAFVDSLRDNGLRPEIMSQEATDSYKSYLAEINEAIAKRRNARTPSKKQAAVFPGKKDEDVLFVYPFTEDHSVLDEAAKGLPDFAVESTSGGVVTGVSTENSVTNASNRLRSHAVTIRVQDYGRLEPLTWLNDSLVDFYMLWISRGMENVQESDVHFFTSHFFSTLSKNGPSAVTSWTSKKNIDIFKKKLIFIPINKTMHWSLCIVVNPGAIEGYELGETPTRKKMPCLIFLDSLKMHRPNDARKHILVWLNSEWNRLRPTGPEKPFTLETFKYYTPKGNIVDLESDATCYW